ncbi:MAG TPA: pyridoxal phosphate-dependent aminotransferase [Longimicrobiales bacterium]|nr:pyridoxal phosphate-dependent aminotransferase [Longimicrobiales bacterium]
MRLSQNIRELQPSATLAVAALCRQLKAAGKDVLDLSAGEPDFRTPDFAAHAGIAAIEQGSTHYPPVPGIAPLRAAIAAHLTRTTGKSIDPAGIVVSTGAKQALFNACFALFGPDDDVLVPAPYWTSYPEILQLARARCITVTGDADNAHKVDTALLEAARTPATRGLLLNSPSNPTGAVYTLDELDAIVRWAHTHELWIISDEIYGRLCYTSERAASVLDLDESLLERTVIVDGVSKSFAMTGWRIGFSCSAPQLARQLAAVQSHITSGASTPAQAAALAAYQDEPRVDEAVRAMVRVFNRRRLNAADALHELLPRAQFSLAEGAFYLFFRVDEYYDASRPDSIAFCRALLEQTGVALVPGSAFGDDRYVRLSFAAPEAEILEGIRRVADFAHGRLQPPLMSR